MRMTTASSLGLPVLAALFNEGFSDYVVPMKLSEDAFRAHVQSNDIDLGCSPVAIEDEPVAFALVGVRGGDAWVGGMGTAPPYRRRGLGEKALLAAIDAARGRGCAAMWLEVIAENEAAIRLYRKLGFERVRELIVWTLDKTDGPAPPSRPVDAGEAREWIAATRTSREPWQRADESLCKMDGLDALVAERDGEIAGAAIYKQAGGGRVTVLQIAAIDTAAAKDVLLAASSGTRDLRLSNAPPGEPPSVALEELGARAVVRQLEMRLAV
jgi:GNAT superfamily N-acetyltransferase